jgi:hypothetical protein
MTRFCPFALALGLCLPLSLRADWRPIAMAPVQVFDSGQKTWLNMAVGLEFEAQAEDARLRVSRRLLAHPLTARLDFKHLPHYAEWVSQNQARGGAEWAALKAVLDEVGDGPAMALTQEPLQAPGSVKVLLGLRRGSHFELFATVPGQLGACGSGLCCTLGEPVFATESGRLLWSLLKPAALRQAKMAANR